MPVNRQSSISSSLLLGFLQRLSIAFMALYAVSVRAGFDSDRAGNSTLSLTADGESFDLASPEYSHPIPVLEARLVEPLAEISPELLALSYEARNNVAKIPEYTKLYLKKVQDAIQHHRWPELNKILNDLPSPIKPDELNEELKKLISTEFEKIWSSFIKKLGYGDFDELSRLSDKKPVQREFSDWWDQNKIAALFETSDLMKFYFPTCKIMPTMHIYQFIYMFGTTKHFEHLLKLKKVNWKDFVTRWTVFSHDENGEKTKMLYDWSINQGYGNIFLLDGLLFNSLNNFRNEEEFSSFKRNKEKIVKLSLDGIISVERELNITIDDLFAFDLTSLKKIAKERAEIPLDISTYASEGISDAFAHDDFEALKHLLIPAFNQDYNERLCLFAARAIEQSKWNIAKGINEISVFKPSEEGKLKLRVSASEKLLKALPEYAARMRDINMSTHPGSTDRMAQYRGDFSRWWEDNAIEALLAFHADPNLSIQGDHSLINYISLSGEAEHFDALFKNQDLPLYAPEYAVLRSNVFLRISEIKIVEKVYQHGLAKWGINIFELPGNNNLSPLLTSLQMIVDGLRKAPVVDITKMVAGFKKIYVPYDEAGIVNFKGIFGKTCEEFFDQEPAVFINEIESKINSAKRQPKGNIVIGLTMLAAAGLITTYCLAKIWKLARPALQNAQPEPIRPRQNFDVRQTIQNIQPERRRHRDRADLPSPLQQNRVVEDPAVIRAREEREAWLSEAERADAAKAAVLAKKVEAEGKAIALQPSGAILAGLYENLAKAYQASYKAYESYTDAIKQVLDSTNDETRNAAIIQAHAAKPDELALNEACRNALADVRRQERADEERLREAELAARRQAKQKSAQTIDQKLNEISHSFNSMKDSNEPILIKLRLLKDLAHEAGSLEIDERKLKPKLSAFEKAIKDIKSQADHQIAALKIYEVFTRVDSQELPVVSRMEQLIKLRTAMEMLGAEEPELKESYRRSKQLFEELNREKQEHEGLLDFHAKQIKQIFEDKESLIGQRLKEAQRHFGALTSALAQLKLSEDAIKPAKEILDKLQQEYDSTPAMSRVFAGMGASESKSPDARRMPKSYLDAVSYTCQLLKHQVDQLDPSLRSEGNDLYIKNNAFLAILYNFARLLELLKDRPAGIESARKLRNHLIHRYYQARDKKDELLALVKAFTDDRVVLAEIQKPGSGDLKDRIETSAYYQRFCLSKEDPRVELRTYEKVENELINAIKGINNFVENISWDDELKGADLDADAKSLLRDSAKMRVIILGELLKGRHKEALLKKLSEQGYDDKKFWEQLEEDSAGNIKALRDSVMKARNIGAHHVKNTFSFRGLFDVTPAISIYVIRDLAEKLKGLLPQEAPGGGAGGPSLVMGSLGAAGGAGRASLVLGEHETGGSFDPFAQEFRPSGI